MERSIQRAPSPILQQLLMHECVRLPIRSVSEPDFERLHGIDIAVAERLVELGFLLPILTHRAPENWKRTVRTLMV